MRRVKSSNEFFDILDQIGDNKFVTIGYVTGANLDVPKVQRKNPLTNRMKGYEDYSSFGEEIGALVKITSYNMRYRKRGVIGKQYKDYKNSANAIRGEYGLPPIGDKENDYKERMNFGGGIDAYKGGNEALAGHSYNPQNTYGVIPKSVTYAINKEGHIVKALSKEEILPYLKKKRAIDGVSALKKMGVEEDRIKEYIQKIENLKFQYKNFEANSILWIAATVNGEKIVYINDNLARTVNDININPQDFIKIANERYQKDLIQLQENVRKTVIRLTESDMIRVINESVKSIIREMSEFKNNDNYSHFAVNKLTGKIVNGWDYAGEDPEDLRQFKRDYFINDLIDYELDPKQYRIVTAKTLIRQGIDPNDNSNWANR